MSEKIKQALEKNEVLLWGIHKVPKALLKDYDVGNKNPVSVARKGTVPSKTKKFEIGKEYGIDDLEFLNSEYDRIDDLITDPDTNDKQKYEDMLDKIDEEIQRVEGLKKNDFASSKARKGGALTSKARYTKGSEEAKAFAKRMQEAKQKKKSEKPPEPEPVKQPKKSKAKPWFYIGDIPKGYREATEDEAIHAKKVSEYGKHKVDEEKYTLFKDYNILLSTDKTPQEQGWYMNGLKRRIMTSLKDIEILKAKVDNEKYKDRWDEYKDKLIKEKKKRKYLQAAWNWYYKLQSERLGKPYERQTFTLPAQEIKTVEISDALKEYKPPPVEIDPRTGKPVTTDLQEELIPFTKDDTEIELKRKYFDKQMKLKPTYSKKLADKGILLDKEYYLPSDYKKYVYLLKIVGYGFVHRKPDKSYKDDLASSKSRYTKDIVQSILFKKAKWSIDEAKKWLKDNGYFNDDIDVKKTVYRFRQYNPEDLKDRKFVTKDIGKGIDLILAIKTN